MSIWEKSFWAKEIARTENLCQECARHFRGTGKGERHGYYCWRDKRPDNGRPCGLHTVKTRFYAGRM